MMASKNKLNGNQSYYQNNGGGSIKSPTIGTEAILKGNQISEMNNSLNKSVITRKNNNSVFA